MAWRLAKSLEKLREQINAMAPDRSKVSDGSIGDAAHASRESDHNPWITDLNGIGVVTAIDITHDPAHGVDGRELVHKLIADRRVKYVIFDRRIWKARTGQWETYRGSNAHQHHVHISVQPATMDFVTPWSLEASDVVRPALRFGDTGQAVRDLQVRLRAKGYSVAVDGDFGKITLGNVKRFQEKHGLTVDGIVGSRTWETLG